MTPGTRCSRPWARPGRRTTGCSPPWRPSGRRTCASAPTSSSQVFTDRGVTFAHAGEEQPFPLDLLPRVIAAAEWDDVVLGVKQRVRALEASWPTSTARARCFTDGIVPRRRGHLERRTSTARPSGSTRPTACGSTSAGVDLVRDEEGRFCALEDNLRVPSGVSYVIENRRAMTQLFPGSSPAHRVHPVDEYPARLLAALRASAPPGVREPVVVVLTPGVYNAAYFEHALLARLMGVELVEGRDLICSGNRVRMRTTQGERPVHVVYRRIDDEYLDPLHFRPDSVIGCPGLLNAARAGHVTIANAVGNGVADDKLALHLRPRADPLLPARGTAAPQHRDPSTRGRGRARVGARPPRPAGAQAGGRAGGKGIVIGPQADEQTLATLQATVLADPRGWVAQRPVALSTAPDPGR